MKVSERFALDTWLTDYPRQPNVTYGDILGMLYDNQTQWVVVWRMAENYPLNDVAELIENTRYHYEQTVDTLKYGISLANLTEADVLEQTELYK